MKLPDRLGDLVSYIVSRASVVCGESLVKTALACILLARRPIHSAQLQRMLNTWLAAQYDQTLAELFSENDEKEDRKVPLVDPQLSSLALHVLLSQLQPLLAGFDLVDSTKTDYEELMTVDDENDDGQQQPPSLFQSGRLRFCSAEVTDAIRDICFGKSKIMSRFAPARRVGYIRSSYKPTKFSSVFKKTQNSDNLARKEVQVKLEDSPNELQTYMLLFIEFQDDVFDEVFYAVGINFTNYLCPNAMHFQFLILIFFSFMQSNSATPEIN